MARARSNEKAAETADEKSAWITGREARLLLGNISAQRLWRLKTEHDIPTQSTDGVLRYDEAAITELGERLGLSENGDSSVAALQVLRDVVESFEKRMAQMIAYVEVVQSNERELVKLLRDENESIRKLRAEEQKSYLENLIATHEALDFSAERKQEALSHEAAEVRRAEMMLWLTTQVWPAAKHYLNEGSSAKKFRELLKSLDGERLAALKSIVTPEEAKALEEILNERQEPHHHAGGPGSGSGPDTAAG